MAFLPSKIPLIQAPMAGAQGPDLAISVCRAGGLGSLPCAMLTSDLLRKEIAAVRAVTEAPFNVNFFCHVEPTPDPAIRRETSEKVARAFRELPPKLQVAATLALIEEQKYEDIAAAVGISVGGVKSRVFRAVRILRRKLERMGIEP